MSHTRRSSSSHSSSASSSPKKKVKRRSSASTDKGPSYRYMITEAIWEEKKYQKGSSRSDIRKFIEKNYDVDESKLKANLTSNFSKMIQKGDNGYACLSKRSDEDSDYYKLTPEWRKEWTKKYGKKHPKKPRKTKKDPNHPKHPKNGYLYYSQDVRKRRQDQNPDKGFKEITNMVAEEWRNLSVAKKKKYLDMAKKDRARYQREMKEYKQSSDSESSRSDESEEKKKRKRAKRSDDEESKSHSAKKRKSRSKTARSYSDSDSEVDEKKKKSSDKQVKTPTKVEEDKK
jgi:hypothetical protein